MQNTLCNKNAPHGLFITENEKLHVDILHFIKNRNLINIMIQHLQNLPSNIVGFKAVGEITENDFTETIMPKVKALIEKTGTLNYLLILETSLKNFTIGAWMKDAMMGIKHLTKWNKAVIVSDEASIRKFTNIFSYFIPGEFKGFEHKDLQQAIDWVSEKK